MTSTNNSTIDNSRTNVDPDRDYGVLYGDFYGLECVSLIIESDIRNATGLSSFSIKPYVEDLQNIVVHILDSGVQEYIGKTYGIVLPDTFDEIIKVSIAERYSKLDPLFFPPGTKEGRSIQGEQNFKVLMSKFPKAVWVGHLELETLITDATDGAVSQLEGVSGSQSIIKKITSDAYAEKLLAEAFAKCHTKNSSTDKLYPGEVFIKADPVPVEPALKPYDGDSMQRRRPDGEYFTVEMVAPRNRGEMQRVDLDAANGQTVSSLMLHMSPASLVINGAKKVNRYPTLVRWVEEHWGDELDQISFSGTSFSFIDFGTTESGLCVASRNMTVPYMELRHLVDIYKMNGIVYQPEELDKNTQPRTFFNYENPANPYKSVLHPRAGMPKTRLYIRMKCYFAEFIGYFESFDVTEDANKPFSLSYNVSFRAEHTKWL